MLAPILGHEAVLQNLENQLRQGRLPHALLFTGPEGIGKRLVAERLAWALLCEKSPKTCGECASCQLLAGNKHPDLTWVLPEEGKIKIDTIRDIKKDFSFAPLMAKARALIVVDAHTMNAAAANALLKTLEEPPANTYFILLSHASGWIPRTIVSRCQKLRFAPLSAELLRKVVPENLSEAALQWSQGSARYAAEFSRVQDSVPALRQLAVAKEWGFEDSYRCAQQVVESEGLGIFLEALLAQIHGHLTQNRPSEKSFELLLFADRILEFKKNLRVNANPKLHLARLLMHFQEPLQSRL